MRHPNPDFVRPLIVVDEELPDTDNAWENHGDPIALTMPLLFLGGKAANAMEARLAQGRLESDGSFTALHHGTALELAASNAVNNTLQTETGYQWGQLQIKTTEITSAILQLTGRAI